MEEKQQPKPKRFPILVLIIVALIAFFLGKSTQSGYQVPSSTSSPQAKSNQLLRSQTATFQGEITKVNKDSVDVKTEKGIVGNLKLSSNFFIYKFEPGATQATSSADINSIETGKRALIILELSENQYKVVSISYQPPPVTPTRTSTKKE